jgi:hypothetical protein
MNAEMPIKAASRHDPAISIFYTQKPVKLFLAFCAGRVVTLKGNIGVKKGKVKAENRKQRL